MCGISSNIEQIKYTHSINSTLICIWYGTCRARSFFSLNMSRVYSFQTNRIAENNVKVKKRMTITQTIKNLITTCSGVLSCWRIVKPCASNSLALWVFCISERPWWASLMKPWRNAHKPSWQIVRLYRIWNLCFRVHKIFWKIMQC